MEGIERPRQVTKSRETHGTVLPDPYPDNAQVLAQLQAIEAKLDAFAKTVEPVLPPRHALPAGRKQARYVKSHKAPPWARDVANFLDQIWAELQGIKTSLQPAANLPTRLRRQIEPGEPTERINGNLSTTATTCDKSGVIETGNGSELAGSRAEGLSTRQGSSTSFYDSAASSPLSSPPSTPLSSQPPSPQPSSSPPPSPPLLPLLDGGSAKIDDTRNNTGPENIREYVVDIAQLGASLIPNIAKFNADTSFTNEISVKGLDITWQELREAVEQAVRQAENYQYTAVQHRVVGNGVSQLLIIPAAFKLPDFTESVETLSVDVEGFLQQVIDSPSEKPIPYYVGPLSSLRLESLFPSGEELSKLGTISGVNTLWAHIGEMSSGSPFHCEDGKCRSYNVVLWGWKLWILIKLSSTMKFETLVDQIVRSTPSLAAFIRVDGKCDQSVRHPSLFISPERLRKEGIEFEFVLAGPGDMVTTEPRQYHSVLNMTRCCALATNYLLPGETAIPPKLVVCPQCGLCPLQHKNIIRLSGGPQPAKGERRVRKRRSNASRVSNTSGSEHTASHSSDSEPSSAPQRSKRKQLETLPDEQASKRVKTIDPERLVSATRDRKAILQFMNLVCSWRSLDETIKDRFRSVDDGETSLPICDDLMKLSQCRSILYEFVERLFSIKLAKGLVSDNCKRVKTEQCSMVLVKRGVKPTAKTRKSLQNEFRKPRKWTELFRDREGLLCFAPLKADDQTSTWSYTQLSASDTKVFKSLLLAKNELSESLNEIGLQFQNSILSTGDFPERLFESRHPSELAMLGLPKLVELLKPFRPLTENSSNLPDWDQPEDWEWDWPAKPDSIPYGEQCCLCKREDCNCISSCFVQREPEIRFCGEKGRGLFAMDSYEKGARIGELVGCIEAPDAHNNGWACRFRRSDLDGEPEVGRIYCRDEGNCFRFINHACGEAASAMPRVERISGKARLVILARRTIRPGDEIEVDWGKTASLGQKECLCKSCQKAG